MNTPRHLPTPPAPRGHFSHLASPELGTLAELAMNPLQPRHVRRFHRQAMEESLSFLAARVASISTRRNNA